MSIPINGTTKASTNWKKKEKTTSNNNQEKSPEITEI